MSHRVGLAVMVATLLGVLLMVPSAASAIDFGCSNNATCAAGTTCQLVWTFLGVNYRTCKAPPLCNADSECAGGGRCVNGVCQPGPKPPGGGSSGPAEGRHCMPADGSKPPGWATDSHGKPLGACPAGTSCNSQGFCMKLQQ